MAVGIDGEDGKIKRTAEIAGGAFYTAMTFVWTREEMIATARRMMPDLGYSKEDIDSMIADMFRGRDREGR